LKCLSLKQPFAELLVSGKKIIELRKWNTNYRGVFLVHASKSIDLEACKRLGIDPSSLIIGAVIGSAEIYDVKHYKNKEEFDEDKNKHLADDSFLSSHYGFLIKSPKRMEKPIYINGKLGFFEVSI
jgi:hypothetical protein